MIKAFLPGIFIIFIIFSAGCGSGSSNKSDSDILLQDNAAIQDEITETVDNDGKKPLPDLNGPDTADNITIDIENDPDIITNDADTDGIDKKWGEKDDDGDGIKNSAECPDGYPGNCRDTDKDGTPDYLDTDSDSDGLPDSVETPNGALVDTDGDGTPDYLDTDSDSDGIPDSVEAGSDPAHPVDSDGDGTFDYRSKDSDGDGIPDSVEAGLDPQHPADSDGDSIPDYIDDDSDNDGIKDIYEGAKDMDEDGLPNYLDIDADGDGIPDNIEKGVGDVPVDSDGDGFPDFKDLDSDNDGLSDTKEKELGTDPAKADTDNDGMSDMAEVAYGSDPLDNASKLKEGDFYVVLPYNDPELQKDLEFSTDIRRADIVIIVDLSNSMSGEHTNLKQDINDKIITNIKTAIPEAAFGLVEFGPINMNEALSTDKAKNVFIMAQSVTDNAATVKSAVDAIAVTPGTNEYMTETIYQAATGEGTYQRICHKVNGCGAGQGGFEIKMTIPPASCPAGTTGGVCFRSESMPIFILMTDEAFFWDFGAWKDSTTATDTTKAITALNGINAKFIGLDSSSNQAVMPDLEQMAIATGSVNGSGQSFNQIINPDGTGMSDNIVAAVKDLTKYIKIEVGTVTKHIPNTHGVTDTTKFITSITPDSFKDVTPGQKVSFDVTFQNTIYENTTQEAHLFKAKINVMGSGSLLDSRDVSIIVPGIITGGEN